MKLMKNKKGFTLIELIVVMIIIAILAAFLIPSMFKYIDEAKQQSVVGEARSVYIASELVVTKAYAGSSAVGTQTIDSTTTDPDEAEIVSSINDYANITAIGTYSVVITDNKVTSIIYTKGGVKVTFTPGADVKVEKA